jgi:hypothetical protein
MGSSPSSCTLRAFSTISLLEGSNILHGISELQEIKVEDAGFSNSRSGLIEYHFYYALLSDLNHSSHIKGRGNRPFHGKSVKEFATILNPSPHYSRTLKKAASSQ